MKVSICLKNKSYDIYIQDNILNNVSSYIDKEKKVFILTDDGIPTKYVEIVKEQFKNVEIFVIAKGEKSKSFITYQKILKQLMLGNYSKKDYLIALGGGVVGDIACFCAGTFKRGMRFINIPTTTLSMVDSSIGGKGAINFEGVKNAIGTFYQPEGVYIDPTVLKTLPKRHINNGMIEALKTGLIGDKTLYEIFVNNQYNEKMTEVIYRSLVVKASIVEKDEKEESDRKVLNFGHTFGHAYEAYFKMKEYLHGEAVALGLLTICRDETYIESLKQILKKMQIKSLPNVDKNTMLDYVKNDKKSDGDKIDVIFVHEIGHPLIKKLSLDDLEKYVR